MGSPCPETVAKTTRRMQLAELHSRSADTREERGINRSKGHAVDIHVVDRLLVMVDGVEMSFDDAKALDRGWLTLDQLARRGGKR
jgi:hypothetical protein